MTFEELREKHPRFVYEGFTQEYDGENLKIKFGFLVDPNIAFFPEVTFPGVSKDRLEEIGEEPLSNLIFNLGLVELLSYWKAFCSKEIVVRSGVLNDEQLEFWYTLLFKGLGEFYFKNEIDFTVPDFVTIKSDEGEPTPFLGMPKQRDLIPVGGGKDSAVTLGIFEEAKKDFTPLVLLTKTDGLGGSSALAVSKESLKEPIVIERKIDPKLLELNKEGYLNGHTPFSAYLAFVCALAAVLYDYKSIIVSNESSANEGNTEYQGIFINHQYSKSFEFEKAFDAYARNFLAGNILYFSFLRPLNELQIARLFFRLPQVSRGLQKL